eukprot:CAMPEP_0119278822 /NCGR_PEP_ID=MMETSP1329-20130426/19769_1 /TAXON_ID=114041 /ORGANISM="Genus nov. species nov., Strain RCC1024" /LENGTH=46 /DNA_ID= /DNA_START= /DNA_END= /DNA_ORIENTATION=
MELDDDAAQAAADEKQLKRFIDALPSRDDAKVEAQVAAFVSKFGAE